MCKSERETGRTVQEGDLLWTTAMWSQYSAKSLLVYGVKQSQRGSRVEEGEPEWLTMRGTGPKQHEGKWADRKAPSEFSLTTRRKPGWYDGGCVVLTFDCHSFPWWIKILPINGWGVKHTFKQIMMEEGGPRLWWCCWEWLALHLSLCADWCRAKSELLSLPPLFYTWPLVSDLSVFDHLISALFCCTSAQTEHEEARLLHSLGLLKTGGHPYRTKHWNKGLTH